MHISDEQQRNTDTRKREDINSDNNKMMDKEYPMNQRTTNYSNTMIKRDTFPIHNLASGDSILVS